MEKRKIQTDPAGSPAHLYNGLPGASLPWRHRVREMKNSVIIKHEQYGLRIRLDEKEEWNLLLEEVREKFTASANFFENAALTLTFDGRTLTEEEEDAVIDIIEEVTDIRILCVFVEDPQRRDLFLRVGEAAAEYLVRQREAAREDPYSSGAAGVRQEPPKEHEEEERESTDAAVDSRYQILTHSLHSGDIVRSQKTVIVLGSIEEGAALTTDRDAIVLGSVRGVIRAGEEHREGRSYFVAASDLRPKKLSIDGIVLRSKKGRFSRSFPAVAAVKGMEVCVVPFDGDVEALLRPDHDRA